MSNMSVGKKLIFGFGVVVLITLIGGIITLSGILTMKKNMDEFNEVCLVQMEYISAVEIALGKVKYMIEGWRNPNLSDKLFMQYFDLLKEQNEKDTDSLLKYEQSHTSWYDAEKKEYDDLKKYNLEHDKKTTDLIAYAREVQQRPNRAELIDKRFIELDLYTTREHYEEEFASLREVLSKVCEDIVKNVDSASSSSIIVTIAVNVISLVLGLGIGVVLSRSITGMVTRISQTLLTNSNNITASSKELAAGSQSLASGSSQQASAVEEISSTLEEISSMVKQNSGNAAQASKLVVQSGISMDATQKAFQRSLDANEEISKASNETSKIIKTIDEIAFQTNLLSLNAAVEAARAGEAGAGFAVVAGEVRGLAMRSAEASKRTAELIAQTIEKVKEGTDVFAETGKNFNMVVEQSQKIQQLVNEVAAASEEQTKGIEQINKGVSEMEKVIQQNAANSEESAASTQELASQAEEMLKHVNELGRYILGSNTELTSLSPAKSGARTAPAPKAPEKKAPIPAPKHIPKLLEKKEPEKKEKLLRPPEKKAPSPAAKPVKHEEPKKADAHHPPAPTPSAVTHLKKEPSAAEQVIPLDESDMADF